MTISKFSVEGHQLIGIFNTSIVDNKACIVSIQVTYINGQTVQSYETKQMGKQVSNVQITF